MGSRRIAQRIAQTIDGADNPTFKIHVNAIRPEGLANFFRLRTSLGRLSNNFNAETVTPESMTCSPLASSPERRSASNTPSA